MTEQTLKISAGLQQQMKRDVAFRALGLTRVIVLFVLLALVIAALVAKRILEPTFAGLDLVGIGIALLLLALIISTIRTARKSLEKALPIGSVVTLRMKASQIEFASVLGESVLQYSSIGRMQVLPSVVLLTLKGGNVLTAVPRELLDEATLDRLRPATHDAFLALAALLADGFGGRPTGR